MKVSENSYFVVSERTNRQILGYCAIAMKEEGLSKDTIDQILRRLQDVLDFATQEDAEKAARKYGF